MFEHRYNHRFVPEFGRIDQRIAQNEPAWHETMQAIADDERRDDLFGIDDMCRYADNYSDAQVIGYVLSPRPEETALSQHAAYRGVVFGHLLLKELTDTALRIPLESYWDTYVNLSKSQVQRRLAQETSDYISESESVDRLLCRFMPEISPRSGHEYIVEAGAALILRQAEFEEVLDDEVRAFSKTIVDL